ncbi:uncharacterized protein LACBIDRAFT_335468 [Laccaria bicolor S238N-H82]|uniref:Predicted protein n=1 Tax=Laccaria bicolor (strain S238N-H82 / ATCC MYA-4686) TaxID=486041 RepID=B0E2F9_LACBS|nr:uncharacterized protein LACBIDRAFT_335468 [Laccaria bicolor S238N-H82]EDQ98960.1 predicted protein [Laccaria bicolor S238N-H82]|eukprot:XP_001890362.1 predicted protein [Laccaria bicolor S238N-H82]
MLVRHLLTLIQHHHSKSLQISEGTRYQSKQPRQQSLFSALPTPKSPHGPSRTSKYDFTPLNDRILPPPCLHIASMPALCPSLLSDSWPLPPLLVPSNETAAVTPLYSPSPFPLPCSGLHHSEAGDAGHAQPRPYPLSPFQSNTSDLWLTVSACHVTLPTILSGYLANQILL